MSGLSRCSLKTKKRLPFQRAYETPGTVTSSVVMPSADLNRIVASPPQRYPTISSQPLLETNSVPSNVIGNVCESPRSRALPFETSAFFRVLSDRNGCDQAARTERPSVAIDEMDWSSTIVN